MGRKWRKCLHRRTRAKKKGANNTARIAWQPLMTVLNVVREIDVQPGRTYELLGLSADKSGKTLWFIRSHAPHSAPDNPRTRI
jgi:hypothetical protein